MSFFPEYRQHFYLSTKLYDVIPQKGTPFSQRCGNRTESYKLKLVAGLFAETSVTFYHYTQRPGSKCPVLKRQAAEFFTAVTS